MSILKEYTGFQWDLANAHKNWYGHQVSQAECEEVFFNVSVLLYEDTKHSRAELRNYVLGKTDKERKLFIAFTIRSGLIRVISARDMSKKERNIYEKIEKTTHI